MPHADSQTNHDEDPVAGTTGSGKGSAHWARFDGEQLWAIDEAPAVAPDFGGCGHGRRRRWLGSGLRSPSRLARTLALATSRLASSLVRRVRGSGGESDES